MKKRFAFLFPGQGVQSIGMGKDYYDSFNVAKRRLEEAEDVLHRKVKTLLFEGPSETLNMSSSAQLAVFIVSAMILDVLLTEAPQVHFEVAAGLSLGEYTALYATKKLKFSDALKLIENRGKWMSEACKKNPGGMMAVIGLTSIDVEKTIGAFKDVWPANYNTHTQLVISGGFDGLTQAEKALKEQKAKVISLKVEGAFHSPYMKPAEELLQLEIAKTTFQNSPLPIVMNRLGEYVYDLDEIKKLMLEQLTGSIFWYKGIEAMVKNGIEAFLEVGHGQSLSQMNARMGINQPSFTLENVEQLKLFLEGECNS